MIVSEYKGFFFFMSKAAEIFMVTFPHAGLGHLNVNLVQSFPQRMGVLNVGQRIEEQAEFEKIYKNGKRMLLLICWHVLCA